MKYVLALLAVIVLVPAILPSQFQLERSVTISTPQEDVYSYLMNLDSWKEWSPWLMQEPSATFSFHGAPGVVGSSIEWKGQSFGSGKQTLVRLQEPEYLETQLELHEPQATELTAYMKIKDVGGKTLVVWGAKGPLSYPLERVSGLFMKSSLGPEFEKGLANLKKQLELRPSY